MIHFVGRVKCLGYSRFSSQPWFYDFNIALRLSAFNLNFMTLISLLKLRRYMHISKCIVVISCNVRARGGGKCAERFCKTFLCKKRRRFLTLSEDNSLSFASFSRMLNSTQYSNIFRVIVADNLFEWLLLDRTSYIVVSLDKAILLSSLI